MHETYMTPENGAVLFINGEIFNLPPRHMIVLSPAEPPAAAAQTDRRTKRVREPATGQEWPSVTALAASIGYSKATIYYHLNKHARYERVGGRLFEYVEQPGGAS